MTEMDRTKSFSLSWKNKEKLGAVNIALHHSTASQELSLTTLNVLHYTVTITMAGTVIKLKTLNNSKCDLDDEIKKRIEDTRKIIG